MSKPLEGRFRSPADALTQFHQVSQLVNIEPRPKGRETKTGPAGGASSLMVHLIRSPVDTAEQGRMGAASRERPVSAVFCGTHDSVVIRQGRQDGAEQARWNVGAVDAEEEGRAATDPVPDTGDALAEIAGPTRSEWSSWTGRSRRHHLTQGPDRVQSEDGLSLLWPGPVCGLKTGPVGSCLLFL